MLAPLAIGSEVTAVVQVEVPKNCRVGEPLVSATV